jgi:hypothetical protein
VEEFVLSFASRADRPTGAYAAASSRTAATLGINVMLVQFVVATIVIFILAGACGSGQKQHSDKH